LIKVLGYAVKSNYFEVYSPGDTIGFEAIRMVVPNIARAA
jgi:hypothetical protein